MCPVCLWLKTYLPARPQLCDSRPTSFSLQMNLFFKKSLFTCVRYGFMTWPRLPSNWPCSPGWPQTFEKPFALASQVLKFQMCVPHLAEVEYHLKVTFVSVSAVGVLTRLKSSAESPQRSVIQSQLPAQPVPPSGNNSHCLWQGMLGNLRSWETAQKLQVSTVQLWKKSL